MRKGMKKTAFLFIYIFSAALLLTACSDRCTGVGRRPSPEIVCWGDSMTEGYGASEAEIDTIDICFDASDMSYPDVLQQLTGMTTYNFGVAGATSEEIAVMQGGITPTEEVLLFGYLNFDVMDESREHKGDILILEIGSNGGWDDDYDTLIDQYNAMIKYAGCDDFIIIGDTDDPENSIDNYVADTAYDKEYGYIGVNDTAWDTALREAFGEHFINMRVFMIEKGLTVAGLTATDEDYEAAERGEISSQLRADWTHFNSYGYYAQAVAVYQKGLQLGYWD